MAKKDSKRIFHTHIFTLWQKRRFTLDFFSVIWHGIALAWEKNIPLWFLSFYCHIPFLGICVNQWKTFQSNVCGPTGRMRLQVRLTDSQTEKTICWIRLVDKEIILFTYIRWESFKTKRFLTRNHAIWHHANINSELVKLL